jgi:putative membrane protein
MAAPEKEAHILVLCVDRDGDLGAKASIKTPILGRDENINAAVTLALKDPEEPDANAIFEAVKVFDRLIEEKKQHEKFQIATISGSELGGVGADRKLVAELIDVLKAFPANEVILVTDGFSDEAVLPLVESRVPVSSVRRIVMRHSQSIEETAAIFTRYLRMITENPRYSKIILGLPGVLLIVLGFLAIFNLLQHAGIAFLIVLGVFLFIRGFGIDKALRGFYRWVREYSPPPFPVQIAGFSAVFGALSMGIGGYLGSIQVSDFIETLSPPPSEVGQWVGLLPQLIGQFISGSIALIVIGVCIIFAGRAIRWYFERDPRLLRTIVIIVVVAWSWQIFNQASWILTNPKNYEWMGLVFAIVIGILWALAAVLVTTIIHKKYAEFFREKEKEVEEFKES